MTAPDATAFFSHAAFENPYPLYAQMRDRGPVCRIGDTRAFLVASHAAVEEAVHRHAEFSAELRGMLVCGENERPGVFDLSSLGTLANVIANADEPEHSVHRRLMLPPLKASRIATMERELRDFAAARVDALLANGGGDICDRLAEPLPAFVVIRLLGLGEDALEEVQRWAMMGGDFLAGRFDDGEMARVFTESAALNQFLCAHFDGLRQLPPSQRGNSLTATLAGGVDDGLIDRQQAVGILTVLFGAAGESTASLLGSAIRLLADDPLLQSRLRNDPALIPLFIEEALRLETPFKFHYRAVNNATTLCGTALEAGDLLLLCWAAANRDPAVWDDPDALRLDRPQPQRHLGFGYGIHYCIGAPLARLEVRVALEELLARTRRIAPDPDRPPAHAPSIFVRRLRHLHLRID